MAQTSDIEKLDQAIAALESKLTAYRALREVLTNSDVADEVRGFFSSNGSAAARQRGPRSKIMQKIEEFFAGRENEWATIGEITVGTKLKVGAIRQALYKGHAGRFDRHTQVGGGRPGQYRLKKQGG